MPHPARTPRSLIAWGILTLGLGLSEPTCGPAASGETLTQPPLGRGTSAESICGNPDYNSGTEEIYGPANVNGVSGNGRLTVGISARGELTLLKWPSSGHLDQMSYLTPPGIFVDPECSREKLRYGASVGDGSFAAIRFTLEDGSQGLSWFRAVEWSHLPGDQYYRTDGSNVLVTDSSNASLGLALRRHDFVHPLESVAVRRFEVTRQPGSTVKSAWLLYFENLQPVRERVPRLPLTDWLLDIRGDYAVAFHGRRDALLHFHPQQDDPARIRAHLEETQAALDELLDHLNDPDRTGAFPEDPALFPGVYIAVGGDFETIGHQCGNQFVRKAGTPFPQSAYWDSVDGRLSGSSIAEGKVDGALATDLTFVDGRASATVFFALARTAEDAFRRLAWAREKGAAVLEEETDRWWDEWISRAAMPNIPASDPDAARIVAFSKRALIGLRMAFDPETGAMVAAPTAQPPYGEDWPRDSAFFNHVLDLAGYQDMVTRHNEWYVNTALPSTPLGRGLGIYDMNYYTDGMPGGPLFFEIDNSALMTWSLWNHYGFLDSPSERSTYLRMVYPAIRKTADLLAACRDPNNGLQCPAFEDDNWTFSQTLHGAITVWLALKSAIEAGRACQATPDCTEREERLIQWSTRLDELGTAIDIAFWDEAERHYRGHGAGAWLLWPAGFLDPEDPVQAARLQDQGRYQFETIAGDLLGETTGGSYQGKVTLALAKAGWRGNAQDHPDLDLEKAIRILTTEVPAPGTLHLGEVFVTFDSDGDGRKEFHQRTALPHYWNQALNYAAALAYYGPR